MASILDAILLLIYSIFARKLSVLLFPLLPPVAAFTILCYNYLYITNYSFGDIFPMSDKNLPPTSRSSFIWDGTKITDFIGCETDVVIPEGATEIGWYAFAGCSSIKSVVIPCSVTEIGNAAFKDCTSLTSVVILEGALRIKYHAFLNCKNLSSVNIPESVKIGYEAFRGCPVPWLSRAWRHKFWDWCKSSHCCVFGE